jgi:hypothetical protein
MSDGDPAEATGWGVWRVMPDGACAVQSADGAAADALKMLLAAVCDDRGRPMLLARGPLPEARALLDGLAAMGLGGLIFDEATAAFLPPPHRAERIGFLPGFEFAGEARCAYRLAEGSAEPPEERPPVRAGLWEDIRAELIRVEGERRFRCQRLAGVAGAGKSHLLGAIAGLLASRGHRVARVGCLPSDEPGTFAAWRSLLRGLLDGGLAAAIRRQGEDAGFTPGLVASLAAFLDAPDPAAEALSPGQYREIVPDFIADLLARQGAANRCGAILDDIQWMDEAGRQVIGLLERRDAALTLVLARRGPPEAGDREIGPLAPEEMRRLLAEHSGYERVTDGLLAEVQRLSGGLPLVAREVLGLLGQRKQLLRLGGTLDLAPAAEDAAPAEVPELGERFEPLPPPLRLLLGACAVWREPFTRGQAELAARAAGPEIDFAGTWNSPPLREFIVATPAADGRFSFYHDLLREAARSRLDDAARRAAHRSALEWMSRAGGVSIAEQAHHARESGHPREAMRLYDQAAVAALDRFALREAREAARAADSLDEDHATDPVARSRKARRCQVEGEAAFHSGMMGEAVALLERALVLDGVSAWPGHFPMGPAVLARHLLLFARGRPWRADPAGSELGSASRAALMLAEIAYFEDDPRRSAAACITAMDLAVRGGESAELATLIAAIACPMSGKRPAWLASRYRNVARAMVRRIGDEAAEAYIEHIGCLVDLGRAAWPETVACATRSAEFWRSRGQVRRMEEACIFGHYAEHFRGELGAAAKWAAALEDSALRRTDGQSQAWAGIVNSVHALAHSGPERAEELSKRPALDKADAITRLSAHVMRALCAWRRGNPWEALDHLATLARDSPAAPSVSSTQFLYAEAALLVAELRHWGPPELRADPAFAPVAADAEKRARLFARGFRIGAPAELAARALGQAGSDSNRARRGFTEAARLADTFGMTLMRGRILCLHGRALGDERLLTEGLALLDRCGARAEKSHHEQAPR